MEIEIRFDCAGVDWKCVSETLKQVGMTHHDPGVHQKAFERSYVRVFAYRGGQLIGFGRAISDGVYQAAVYDVAVAPEFQSQGIGSKLMAEMLSRLSGFNVILYASPGKEGFYRKLGMRRMQTGMARFQKPEAMTHKGFTD
jgi:ribosomal protein S18 acetylase RimI-like enzyme